MPRLPRLLSLMAIALVCLPVHAHLTGITYTSVWIAKDSIRLTYTVPADDLAELERLPDQQAELREASAYVPIVMKGFQLSSGDRDCALQLDDIRVLDPIQSYQYTVSAACARPLEVLTLGYRSFVDRYTAHENFVDVHLGRLNLETAVDRFGGDLCH